MTCAMAVPCVAMRHGAFTLAQAMQLFDMSKASVPKKGPLPDMSPLENVETISYTGAVQRTNGVLASCDDDERLHLFVHKNSTLVGCAWGAGATAADRSMVMADLRKWHALTIEPLAGRALDAQLYMVEDVRAWWGV